MGAEWMHTIGAGPLNVPQGPPWGTCDWGDCEEISVAWRFDPKANGWLCVCDYHAHNTCDGCHNEIDPDTCWCGTSLKGHNSWADGHSFVPMGCRCFFAKPEPLVQIAPDARVGKPPCGECHLNPGETCNICGAVEVQR